MIDWHSAPLTLTTVITKNYKTTQNVRRFFNAQMGKEVKLGSDFMRWMKASVGKTLAEAVAEFKSRQ